MKNRPRGGLGRGLGALIPTGPAPAAAGTATAEPEHEHLATDAARPSPSPRCRPERLPQRAASPC